MDPARAAGRREEGSGDTLTEYTPTWIEQRTVGGQALKPRTKSHYTRLFEEHIKPTQLGKIPLSNITVQAVRQWHATTLVDKPTYRAHAYGLLHAVLATAVTDGHLPANPAQISGAGGTSSKKQAVILDVPEVARLADTIDERFKALVLISAWCVLCTKAIRIQKVTRSRSRRTWPRNGNNPVGSNASPAIQLIRTEDSLPFSQCRLRQL